jgi:hypothetical protein
MVRKIVSQRKRKNMDAKTFIVLSTNGKNMRRLPGTFSSDDGARRAIEYQIRRGNPATFSVYEEVSRLRGTVTLEDVPMEEEPYRY